MRTEAEKLERQEQHRRRQLELPAAKQRVQSLITLAASDATLTALELKLFEVALKAVRGTR